MITDNIERIERKKLNITWNNLDKTNIGEIEPDNSNTHNYIASHLFNQKEKMEKNPQKVEDQHLYHLIPKKRK